MRPSITHFLCVIVLINVNIINGDFRLEPNEILPPDSTVPQESGQTIRLRRWTVNGAVGEGRVEVYYGGRWGLVCDDFFDLTGASVVCKQLGFNRGAVYAKGKSSYGISDLRVFNVANLVCTGSETSIFQCRRSTESQCNPDTESAGVKCKLNHPSRCEPGGILFDRSCYYFNAVARKTFSDADTDCRSRGGTLAIIESQEENDFISEALFAAYGVNQPTWLIGGKQSHQGRWQWQTESTLTPSIFSKWMPGVNVSNGNGCIIMKHNADNAMTKDYYYWDTVECGSQLPYICETPPRDIGCIQASGKDYQGNANVSAKGLQCWKWNDPRVMSSGAIFSDQANWDHNYCRNPDEDTQPWCVVDVKAYDYCDIPDCGTVNQNSQVQLCEADQIRCGDLPKCVAKDFLCDYEEDCPNGFDEQNCTDWLSNFQKMAGEKLISRVAEIWTYVPHPQGCAKRCLDSKSAQCSSFSFISGEKSCLLGTQTRDQGAVLTATSGADFYELRFAMTTTPAPTTQKPCTLEEFTCNNKNCIAGSALCDGVDNCGDNSDEKNCTVGKSSSCPDTFFQCRSGPCIEHSWICDGENDCGDNSDENPAQCRTPIEVRLVNGSNGYTGRVEVKYYNIWGTICADRLDTNAANVICRMLGRNVNGTLFAPGYFGSGKGPIWLDDITCTGNETSVKECNIKKWGYSDCTHAEDAGITCPDTNASGTPAPTGPTCGRQMIKGSARDPRKPMTARVVGGFEAVPGAFPWTAAIRLKPEKHHCGATVVSEFYLLTAAHCFEDGRDSDVFEVVVGDWDNKAFEGTEQVFGIERIDINPNYQNVLKDDIAVVKIQAGAHGKGILFNDYSQPACLPQADTPYKDGTKCVISGWGSMGVQYPNILQAAQIPMLSDDKCHHPDVYDNLLSSNAFCAGFLSGGIDSCQGDSGGPFVCLINGQFTLMGVISWGDGCAEKNKPGVYTKVVEYLPWINEKTSL